MRVFKDFIKGDEMMSEIFPFTLEYEETIMKVQSHYKPADKVGEINIGRGDEFGGGEPEQEVEDEPVEKVCDIPYNYKLQEYSMSKKEFMSYIKEYFKKIVDHLEKSGKSNRVETFKKGATAFTKFIVPKFDDLTLYIGQNGEGDDGLEGGIAISYWENESAPGPVLYFFKDALDEVKY